MHDEVSCRRLYTHGRDISGIRQAQGIADGRVQPVVRSVVVQTASLTAVMLYMFSAWMYASYPCNTRNARRLSIEGSRPKADHNQPCKRTSRGERMSTDELSTSTMPPTRSIAVVLRKAWQRRVNETCMCKTILRCLLCQAICVGSVQGVRRG